MHSPVALHFNAPFGQAAEDLKTYACMYTMRTIVYNIKCTGGALRVNHPGTQSILNGMKSAPWVVLYCTVACDVAECNVINVTDTILRQGHHDRVMQLNWLYFCGICHMMPLKVWPNTALGCNHQSICMPQLQPLWGSGLLRFIRPFGEIHHYQSGWILARTWDGTSCEFNSWQCRINIISHVHFFLRLLGSLRGSLYT